LTGSGVSVASGVPSFHGNDEFWKRKDYGGETDPLQILTRLFFDKDPLAVWNWHSDLSKLLKDK